MEPLTSAIGGAREDVGITPTYDDEARQWHGRPMPTPQATTPEARDMIIINTKSMEDRKPAHHSNLSTKHMSSQTPKKSDPIEDPRGSQRPLNLLNLPLDILKDVLKEVTHTNDLTSLARSHSALHRLVTPLIYSRFDIVWPDVNTTSEPRAGVDALTYGLATLCMAEDVFGEAEWQREKREARRLVDGQPTKHPSPRMSETQIRRRRGNYYGQFIRKFCLGNGPREWVQEYLISKESGKMLGTLVSLAVARMRSLETFVWDMPTGILSDIWMSLSYLGDRQDGEDCRLSKVWVRYHDNAALGYSHNSPPQSPDTVGQPSYGCDNVEQPSFSILPPLKSLSVLEIDELQYLDEISVLIGRSTKILKELRIGIARHATDCEWVTSWDGEGAEQIDQYRPTKSSETIGGKRLGGALGILTGSFYDMREKRALTFRPKRLRRRSSVFNLNQSGVPAQGDSTTTVNNVSGQTSEDLDDPLTTIARVASDPAKSQECASDDKNLPSANSVHPIDSKAGSDGPIAPWDVPACNTVDLKANFSGKLELESLELERVPLSATSVLEGAIDWTKLTSLTLLGCPNHDQLWKLLRSTYGSEDDGPKHRRASSTLNAARDKQLRGSTTYPGREPPLRLRKIHTNTVSSALISFIKDCLVPNTLESIFFQDSSPHLSSVDIGSIFRGVIKRHRSSLRKVLIDSTDKPSDAISPNSTRWRKWSFGREMIAFFTSGKMPVLRELGMSIDRGDWHYFLQRLPAIPHLRSLYLPHIAQVHGPAVAGNAHHATTSDPRELALQVIDIIVLKPEIELCYVGIAEKCFEVQEAQNGDSRHESHENVPGSATHDDSNDDDEGQDEDDDDGEEDDEDSDDDDGTPSEQMPSESDGSESDDELSSSTSDGTRLRLREILFYDDKVSIFKARHGKL